MPMQDGLSKYPHAHALLTQEGDILDSHPEVRVGVPMPAPPPPEDDRPTLLDVIEQSMPIGEGERKRWSARLLCTYATETPESRAAIDRAFGSLCGYALGALATEALAYPHAEGSGIGEPTLASPLAECECAMHGSLMVLLGDPLALAYAERCQRWRSQGSAHPLMVSLGDGDLVCGDGTDVASLVPCLSAVVRDGAVTDVRLRLSTAHAHTWDNEYLVPLEAAYPAAHPDARRDLAAARYARDWLSDVQRRIAAHEVEPLD